MKPWALVHRGRVMASALRYDVRTLGEAECRRRILEGWCAGDTVSRVEGGLLHRFGTPRVCFAMGGALPFEAREGVLVSVPLRDAEWRLRPEGRVIEVRGGSAVPLTEQPVDAATWLQLPETGPELQGLGPPPISGRAVFVREGGVGRADFGVESLSAEASALLEDLSSGVPPAREAGWRGLGASVGAFLEKSLGRTAQQWGLGSWLQDRHSAQLDALLNRFGGDLDAALRHAIPMGGTGGAARSHPALRRRVPRENLSPSLSRDGGEGGTVVATSDRYEALRAVYRQAAAQLEAAGDIEKAAFVFADLLGMPKEAVDVLERHGRYGLAARLTETHDLGIDKAIRLHLLAGDLVRGFALAAQHDAFAKVLSLFRGDPEATTGIRAAWAARLIQNGDFEAAIDAVWPIPTLRPGAEPWMRVVLESGGEAAGRVLARFWELAPEEADAYFEHLLRSELPEDIAVRTALAAAAQKGSAPRAWLRPLARQVLVDAGKPGSDDSTISRLLALHSLADISHDQPVRPQAETCFPLTLTTRAGGTAVCDAVRSPHGTLVALGEAGLVFFGRDGLVRWSDPTPATALVGDPRSFDALALSRVRDEVWRVARVDLRSGTVREWVRTELQAFANRSAGGRWVVMQAGRLLQIDLTVDAWEWLWRGAAMPASVVRIEQHAEEVVAIVDTTPAEAWRFDAGMVLRHRVELETACEGPVCAVANGWLQASRESVLTQWSGTERRHAMGFEVTAVGMNREGAVVAGPFRDGMQVVWMDPAGANRRRLELVGARRVSLRVEGGLYGVFDDRGTVLWLSDEHVQQRCQT